MTLVIPFGKKSGGNSAAIANCRTIEKVEISTSIETILWEPEFILDKNGLAAPGIGTASFHPLKNKVVFMTGPDPEEVAIRGFYSMKNRTTVEVSADGSQKMSKLEVRNISNKITPSGAHRGSAHSHQYSKDGTRIGFAYDNFS